MRFVILRLTDKNILKDKKVFLMKPANVRKNSGISLELLDLKVSLLFLVDRQQRLICNSRITNQRIIICQMSILPLMYCHEPCKGFRKYSIN